MLEHILYLFLPLNNSHPFFFIRNPITINLSHHHCQNFSRHLQVEISTPVTSSIPVTCIPDQHESRPTNHGLFSVIARSAILKPDAVSNYETG